MNAAGARARGTRRSPSSAGPVRRARRRRLDPAALRAADSLSRPESPVGIPWICEEKQRHWVPPAIMGVRAGRAMRRAEWGARLGGGGDAA